ncbi:T-complex protein 1 subunit delta, partial [Musa troglodytarum]
MAGRRISTLPGAEGHGQDDGLRQRRSHHHHSTGGPTRVENANIAVIQFQISHSKTDIEQSRVDSDYTQMDRIPREERNYILGIVTKIKATGCNVLLIQKGILIDAVTDLSLHHLAKAKILVIKDVEREEIEFITKTLNCLPIANIEHFREEKLGLANCVEEVLVGDGKIVKMTGIKDMGRTATELVRGSNQLVIDEAERSLHDALCVMLGINDFSLLVEVLQKLRCEGNLEFAEALEVIPYTLAENAGLNPMVILTELRNRHAQGETNAGIKVRKGQITNILGGKFGAATAGYHKFNYTRHQVCEDDLQDRRHYHCE